MNDIQRVWLRLWIAGLPFILVSIIVLATTGSAITASSQLTSVLVPLLIITAAFAALIFWKSDRIRHYNKVFGEHENNYRYIPPEPDNLEDLRERGVVD